MVSFMLASIASIAVLANSVFAGSLTLRDDPQGVLIGCLPGALAGCPCPTDKNGDSGRLINVFPTYQCAYPNGACDFNFSVRVCMLNEFWRFVDINL